MTATPLVYRYVGEDPDRIGWCPAFKNSHGMVMVGARIVPADHKLDPDPDKRPGISDEPKYVFENGKPFRCVEGSELHEYCRSSTLFRRVPSNEYQVAGDGSVLLADNVEAAKIPVPPPPDREPLHEDEIRGPTNSSWAALEEVSSRELMRHSSHGGKRGGNER
jgi:hypothetical protein